MPNHVTNELTAPENVLDFLAKGESLVDFNTVVPMPETLSRGNTPMHVVDWARIATGHFKLSQLSQAGSRVSRADDFRLGNYGAAATSLEAINIARMIEQGPFPKDFSDADFRLYLQYVTALRETGYTNWSDWCPDKWGTKWNAYEAKRVSPACVRFQTAWSLPLPVIVELSAQFPEHCIRLRWADEDFGSNVGDMDFWGGKVHAKAHIRNQSREAFDLAIELIHGGRLPDDMRRRDDGTVEYSEN